MPTILSNSRTFVTGKTGSGKSHWVKKVLLPIFPGTVIFHDPKIECHDLLVNHFLCETPQQLRDALVANRQKILYQPRNLSWEDFNKVCEIVYNRANATIFLDEAALYCSPSEINEWHQNIMCRGRSRGVGIVNTTQRPRSCHSLLISEAENFVIFKLQLETDIAKVKYIVPREFQQNIYSLENYNYIFVQDNVAKLMQPC